MKNFFCYLLFFSLDALYYFDKSQYELRKVGKRIKKGSRIEIFYVIIFFKIKLLIQLRRNFISIS